MAADKHSRQRRRRPGRNWPGNAAGMLLATGGGGGLFLPDSLADIVWALDTSLRWTYLNPSAEAFLGIPLKQLGQRTLAETFPPDSLAMVTRVLGQWTQTARPTTQEPHVLLNLDIYDVAGKYVPVEVLARPLRDHQGRLAGYCGTARDMRPRRRMEQTQGVLNHLAKGLLECEELAQTQALASASAEDLTGAVLALAAHRDPETGRFHDMDGRLLPAEEPPDALCVPVLHAGETVGRILAYGIAPERTEEARQLLERVAALFALAVARIRAEGALRKSERRARMLLESMHEGVWAVDRDQHTIFVNERLAAMLGYPVAVLHTLCPTEVLNLPERLSARERHLEHRLGFSCSADYELTRRNGERLPVHVSASPILDESGGFEGLVYTAVDLSERKRMEEELRRNQARSEALYELSRLTAATEAQMAAFALREALRLTESTAGVLFFVGPGGLELTPLAWSGGPEPVRIGAVATTGESAWAGVFAARKPLIMNDFSPFAGGLPRGHMEVARFLGVPALDGGQPSAILGLTGKAADYSPDDSLQVALLMDGMWRIVRGRRDEERIRASLREKEALLSEVHHRVKNNLQVVSSLLDMAGRRLPEAEARRSMEEVRAKVLAMSLVHAQLHGEGAAGPRTGRGIDLERYVRALFRQLREIYSGGLELSLKVMLEELELGLDQAAPLGLALNEILANAFKHGQRPGQPGRVCVHAWREDDGHVSIEVRDDGPGLPRCFVPEQARSLGMTLMFGLVRNQLGGQLRLESLPGGVCVGIRFRPNIVR